MIAATGAAAVIPARPAAPSPSSPGMTLAEKLGQLSILSADYAVTGPVVPTDVDADVRSGRVGSLFNLWGREAVRKAQRIAVEDTRLGIPLFFALDVIHGFRTVFPIPLAEAGAFDPALWEATARAAAAETTAAGIDLTFAPMLDVARDPRWGRIAEGPGEDPYVAATFATAKVRGYQGDTGLAATPKHFAAYATSLAGRDYAATEVSPRTLAEVYLPPFRAAVDAGALAIMPAFTDIDGIPLTAHRGLLTGLLREQWGFDGVVISDYTAVNELVKHGVAADVPEAAALALNAGVDIDMMSRAYERGLPIALDRGLVAIETIDAAVARVLTLKERLGLLDDPYVRLKTPDADLPATRATARDAATRSIVLLRNRGDTLPLPAAPRSSPSSAPSPTPPARCSAPGPAPAAARRRSPSAPASPPPSPARHPLRRRLPHRPPRRDRHPPGRRPRAPSRPRPPLPRRGRVDERRSREPRPHRPPRQPAPPSSTPSSPPASPRRSSSSPAAPSSSRPSADRAAALLACWFPGSEAGHAVADLLTGRAAPSAGLPVTWPRDVGQVPITYAARPGGRPEEPANKYSSKYLDLPNTPAFAFGHGLDLHPLHPRRPRPSPAGRDAIRVETDRDQRRRPPRHRHRLPLPPRPRRPRRPPDPRAPPLRPRHPRPRRDRDRRLHPRPRRPRLPRRRPPPRSSSPAPSRSTSASPPTPAPSGPPASRSAEPADARLTPARRRCLSARPNRRSAHARRRHHRRPQRLRAAPSTSA